MSKKKNIEMVPVNRRKFILSSSPIPEDRGYTYEQVREMLEFVAENDDADEYYDPDFVNDIVGTAGSGKNDAGSNYFQKP